MDAETDMLSIDSSAEAETFPKRNGWLRYACSKFDPAPNKPTKLEFIEKPVKTIPSEMVGYMFTRAYVWAEPKEWLRKQLESAPSTRSQRYSPDVRDLVEGLLDAWECALA